MLSKHDHLIWRSDRAKLGSWDQIGSRDDCSRKKCWWWLLWWDRGAAQKGREWSGWSGLFPSWRVKTTSLLRTLVNEVNNWNFSFQLLDVTTQRHSQYARIKQRNLYDGGRSMFAWSAALRVGKWFHFFLQQRIKALSRDPVLDALKSRTNPLATTYLDACLIIKQAGIA